jgi:hypothetical protein
MDPLTHKILRQRIEQIKLQIDALEGLFFTEQNSVDFRYELDDACTTLDDAVDVLDRDEAYRSLSKQCQAAISA